MFVKLGPIKICKKISREVIIRKNQTEKTVKINSFFNFPAAKVRISTYNHSKSCSYITNKLKTENRIKICGVDQKLWPKEWKLIRLGRMWRGKYTEIQEKVCIFGLYELVRAAPR